MLIERHLCLAAQGGLTLPQGRASGGWFWREGA